MMAMSCADVREQRIEPQRNIIMKMIRPLIHALLLLAVTGTAWASDYSYPNTWSPLFTVSIPDNWQVSVENELLHAGPTDGSVYLGFWALDAADTDRAGDAVDEIISGLVRNFQITNEDNLEVNGIPMYYIEGNGQYVEGGPMNVSVGLFSPDGQTFCVVLFFGHPEAERRHEPTLIRVIESIRRG